ncbi:S6 family peptidase [Helicobacter canis]|uniref:Anti-codon nuclease masking agent n=1 Tax=Helicobacter canis TaxID=29419 RepID=A0A377J432_9HELI|nr:S6 family peptidase [Helicobacter canis]STO97014.1 anti-codon nuclease masking agent [Helicobacter canis]
MKVKVLCVSLVVAQWAWAMNVDKANFYTRDYLDFGQNLGQFTPGAKNLTIIRKDGVVVDLPDLPFPDFSKFNGSNKTSVGGAYTASAKHIVHPNNRPQVLDPNIRIGDSSYADKSITTYANDSAYTRVNKFIVEGGYKVISFNELKKNAANYMTRYKDDDRIVIYRSGEGIMSFQHWDGSPNAQEMVRTGVRAGNLFYVKPSDIGGNQLVVRPNGNHYGPIKGVINSGDSGSPIFVFNKTTQEWELVGTTHGGTPRGQKVANTFWAITDPSRLDNFKKQFEIARVANGAYENTKDKDSVYTDSGAIVINSEVDQGIGGIILRGGGKTLSITGGGSFSGAGIDIDERDSKVIWDIGVKGDLHKIGRGELEVTKATNGNLRMGQGRVVLKAQNSFNSVYLGNAEGELIFEADNAVKDFNISFSKSGGTLNLNGFNATMSGVKAYNASAFITNKNEEKLSTLTLNNANKTMIHAHISGNTAIKAQAASNASANNNAENRAIIFDGGFAIKELGGSGQHIVLQGKPVPHATWKEGCKEPAFLGICEEGHYINKYDRPKAQQMGQGHKVVNQTVFFNQPDWLQREYRGHISLDSGSKLFIEKNADVKANITLDNSTLEFNSKMLYIDNNDSKSLNQSIQNQTLGNGNPKDTITYKGDIIAKNSSKIESKNGIKSFEASVYLDKSTFDAKQDDIKLLAGGLTLLNGSTFSAKSLKVEGIESLIWIDKDSSLSASSITITNSPFTALYTAKEDFSKSNATTPTAKSADSSSTAQANPTITATNSTLYIAKDSKIPSISLQSNSKVWFEYMSDSTSLSKINFASNGGSNTIMAQTLHHAQGQNMAWKNGNGTSGSSSAIASLSITDMLHLSNVGDTSGTNNGNGSTSSANTSDDNRFLALDLPNTTLHFASNARVWVEFAKTHDELFTDTTLNHDGSKLYPMLKAKKLETQGDLIVGFAGQTSRSTRQAVATHTSTGIDISFTDINQVDPSKILADISKTLPSIKDIDSRQKILLDSLLQAQRDHQLVLDAAFNKHSIAAATQLLQGIQKIDSNAKQIAKNVSQDANLALINEQHNIITNRISTLRLSRKDAPLSQAIRLASLKSDVPDKSLTRAALSEPLRNNVWANAGGGYLNGAGGSASSGYLAYTSTNMGYDRSFGSGEKSWVAGGLLSFGASFGSNSVYSENAMNYGAGLYTAMKLWANELQLDMSYVASLSQKSAQNISKIESLNHSVGVNAVYKYAFEIGRSNAIKPVLGLEYVANMMGGYTLDLLRVNDYTYYALSGLAGLEYAYTNKSFFFSIRGAGKKAFARAGDVQVGIDGANRFVGYGLQSDEMIYKLDWTGDYKVGALTLGAAANLQATMSGRVGVSGLVKIEYRF